MNQIEVHIISPDEEIYKGKAEMVVIPGEEGDFSAMYEHAPFVTYLRPGRLEVNIFDKKKTLTYFVRGGFVKVEDNKCFIMVDYIKEFDDIDIKYIEEKIALLRNKINIENNDFNKHNITKDIDMLQAEVDFVKDC